MKLWREIPPEGPLNPDLEARTPAARLGRTVWRFDHATSEWRYAPDLRGVTGVALTDGSYGVVLQPYTEPVLEPIVGEAAVTEPEIRWRALDAATRALGPVHHLPPKPPEEMARDLARIHVALARALEPYLRGDDAADATALDTDQREYVERGP